MISSFDPRTGEELGQVAETEPAELDRLLRDAAAAAEPVRAAEPRTRRAWLDTLADALDAHAEELAALADAETALGMDRLRGEVARTAGQLRFYGSVAAEGGYLGVTLDESDGTAPALVRVNRPLGPVAVFGASNFPFAFSVLGNDTASALAAGCPVVVKGHPAHPRLSAELGELATATLRAAGAPAGAFSLVQGYDAGIRLVRADEIQAVAFTGSQRGGLALWRLANERERVIPVFAEMGTVNPVVVTPAAGERAAEIAAGFVASYTLGSGQYCTKPGLLFAPAGAGLVEAVAEALTAAGPRPVMLTEAIAHGVREGAEAMVAAGATEVASVEGAESGWGAPARLLRAPIDSLGPGSRLVEECFGAVAVIVEYDAADQLHAALGALQPALAASVFTGAAAEDAEAGDAIRLLGEKVGRVAVNEWPTGVAYTWAQQHGGPWPSTSAPATTSVGAAALSRFVRPVTYQATPDAWLPPEARTGNPWELPRRVNGVVEVRP